MRTVYFAWIDFLKTKRMKWLILPGMLVFSGILSYNAEDMFGSIGVIYCLFCGQVMASIPFSSEKLEEQGFLSMLPAKLQEPVLGHFLYAFLVILVSFLMGTLGVSAVGIIKPSLMIWSVDGANIGGLYLSILGLSLLFTAMEGVFMTLFRFESARVQQLIRLVPPFLFFFGMSSLSLDQVEGVTETLPRLMISRGGLILAISLVLYVLVSEIAANLSVRQDLK